MMQCQCKDNVCSLIFPTGIFHQNNYDILCYSFLLFFPQGFRSFYTSICYIYICRFFPLGFLKIEFILCDVQVLKGECYNTKFSLMTGPSRQLLVLATDIATAPAWFPLRPNGRTPLRHTPSRGHLACIKAVE
jgi:hypothetical protein